MNEKDFNAGLRARYLSLFDEIAHKEGILAKDLAKKVSISPIIVSAFRRGERAPTTKQLLKISDYSGYDLSLLIRGEQVATKKPATLDSLQKDLREIKSILKNLK